MNAEQLQLSVISGNPLEVFERPFNGGAVFDITTVRSGKKEVEAIASEEVSDDAWSFEATDESGDRWVGLVNSDGLKLFWTNKNGSLAGGHHTVPFEQVDVK